MRTYAPLMQGAEELARAFAMAPSVEAQAGERSLADQISLAMNQARMDQYGTRAALNRQRLKERQVGPGEYLSAATGLPAEQVRVLQDAYNAGGWGEANPRPEWYTPDIEQRFNDARLAIAGNRAATGDTNGQQLVRALQDAMKIGQQRQIIEGDPDANPQALARAMAAGAGRPTTEVTPSGIVYDPYGSPKQTPNTDAFLQNARIRADATVRAAMERAKVTNKGKLPAEAQLILFYRDVLKYPQEKAVQMAKAKKNRSIQDVAVDVYLETLASASLKVDPTPEEQEEAKRRAEEAALAAVEFLSRNADRIGVGNPGSPQEPPQQPPVPGARLAPDGKWYVQKDGRWYRVDE